MHKLCAGAYNLCDDAHNLCIIGRFRLNKGGKFKKHPKNPT